MGKVNANLMWGDIPALNHMWIPITIGNQFHAQFNVMHGPI